MAEKLFLTDEQSRQVERRLVQLHGRSRALYTLLADVTGQLLSAVGMAPNIEPVTLAALAASNMAATAEMARLTGEPDSFTYLFHEGRERNIYITAVGEAFLLVVLFDRSTQIGWVRLLAKEAAEDLLAVVEEIQKPSKPTSPLMGADFGESLASELDQVFGTWD